GGFLTKGGNTGQVRRSVVFPEQLVGQIPGELDPVSQGEPLFFQGLHKGVGGRCPKEGAAHNQQFDGRVRDFQHSFQKLVDSLVRGDPSAENHHKVLGGIPQLCPLFLPKGRGNRAEPVQVNAVG